MSYPEIYMDKNMEEEPRSAKWFVDCVQHGPQDASSESIQRWDEVAEKTLRDLGELGEDEPFLTGDCSICGSTFQAHQYQSISKHTLLS